MPGDPWLEAGHLASGPVLSCLDVGVYVASVGRSWVGGGWGVEGLFIFRLSPNFPVSREALLSS